MASSESTDVAVIGAGNIGIAVAYYLVTRHRVNRIVLLDPRDPMSLTSAHSGENYRNWWPHPVMTAYTDHAIDLLEDIARASANRIQMTRRGYALVTRRDTPEDLIDELRRGYGEAAGSRIRIHERGGSYLSSMSADWQSAPDGVDVLLDRSLIRTHFPSLAPDAATILHIRRAGDISGQQLGQLMLETVRAAGGRLHRARVRAIQIGPPFVLTLEDRDGSSTLRAERIVNAAGPFLTTIAGFVDEELPVTCVYQQKLAFEDYEGAIPRHLPFTIDLDGQELAWTDDERAELASEPDGARLLRSMPGGIHRRPEGGEGSRWIKLGWAYNTTPSDPADEPPIDPTFPDVVLRGASRLSPGLRGYIGRLPRRARHYGGYYTMTAENWPLIGPMRTSGMFMAGALSGFGTMAATATGAVCAAWVAGAARPPYADAFTLDRYKNQPLMSELLGSASKGVL